MKTFVIVYYDKDLSELDRIRVRASCPEAIEPLAGRELRIRQVYSFNYHSYRIYENI
ncbi:hypothetical protein M2451_002021 [Dysgonomonas sp. PFB1-18]|uniref:hypothetical protein n=1 Tax=unclassified Dysgonomonas TaxID=2630389 RepID=UPI0024743DCB|nr:MULTISPECIES: hypothetical protein [unclassified Dysgonomonas]MDH6309795.1 hypothetical protein [Dysgonomonas sp. PF1-14]MDH6339197.1 hypothetical protein [Dysgonomonas sp. PF1-16]MDH6380696.1 hypothetical protein [Dysgonomonas sp. PFB1-18]MDH6398192.1 hypothetical protein [Dysgonomonas sp. PF1-23]